MTVTSDNDQEIYDDASSSTAARPNDEEEKVPMPKVSVQDKLKMFEKKGTVITAAPSPKKPTIPDKPVLKSPKQPTPQRPKKEDPRLNLKAFPKPLPTELQSSSLGCDKDKSSAVPTLISPEKEIIIDSNGLKFYKNIFKPKPKQVDKPQSLEEVDLPAIQYTSDINGHVLHRESPGRSNPETVQEPTSLIKSMTEEEELNEGRAPEKSDDDESAPPPLPHRPMKSVAIKATKPDLSSNKELEEDLPGEVYEEADDEAGDGSAQDFYETCEEALEAKTKLALNDKKTQKSEKEKKKKELEQKKALEKQEKEKEKLKQKRIDEREKLMKKYQITPGELESYHVVKASSPISTGKNMISLDTGNDAYLIKKLDDRKWIIKVTSDGEDILGVVDASKLEELNEEEQDVYEEVIAPN